MQPPLWIGSGQSLILSFLIRSFLYQQQLTTTTLLDDTITEIQ